MKIREINIGDHNSLIELFENTPGVTVREADSREATEIYLQRNPGLNFIAEMDNKIIGCVMCGHDGRRGYLQHLVVRLEYRDQGLGRKLFSLCIDALGKMGINKTHIFVFKDNDLANKFWLGQGWSIRDDLNMYSYNATSNPNA